MNARERFNATRKAIVELDNIKALIMSGGDDWLPPGVKSSAISDPTATRAIRNVDELQGRLEALRSRESELESFIGVSLALIEAVRDGLGDKYANVLDARYIDGCKWSWIAEEYGIKRQRGNYLLNIAFDYIDSVGVSRLLKGETEL